MRTSTEQQEERVRNFLEHYRNELRRIADDPEATIETEEVAADLVSGIQRLAFQDGWDYDLNSRLLVLEEAAS